MTSGGNNLNDFPENQLTKFRAVYTVRLNVNRGPKSCRQSFTQEDSRGRQQDGLNWHLFTAIRSFIKPNRLHLKFTHVYS